DLVSGNVSIHEFVRTVAIATFNALQRLRRGGSYPREPIGRLQQTPACKLDLRPGDRVHVRDRDAIGATLDTNNKNRGLWFDVEMVPYCGGIFTVQRRVQKIINERSGQMMSLPGECIVLDDVICSGRLSRWRLFCPRAITPYWREIWLEPVDRSAD